MLNDYNAIADIYTESNTKPDKLYSILPTVIKLCTDTSNVNSVVDLGCGDGFFTFPIANLYKEAVVVGLDNSSAQIEKAQLHKNRLNSLNTKFVLSDIFADVLPHSDIVIAPFVFGYLKKASLNNFLLKLKNSLNTGGRLVIVLDDPQGSNNKKYGAVKTVEGDDLKIDLYDKNESHITTLNAIYHEPSSFVEMLKEVGFVEIEKHVPIISDMGLEKYGKEWWADYVHNSELMYITCKKK